MNEKNDLIPPAVHKKQIEMYRKIQPAYKTYALAMKRVLENAKGCSIPEAIIQTREKSLSSFAEKCARKYDKYKDAINQLTDLCGARVIVQTMDQVSAVKLFIESNFEILEKDDKGSSLGEKTFGYRDMHYIVRIPEPTSLGFTKIELNTIGNKRAEIQVRTWVQHAWADTLHDRMYKTPLKYSTETHRKEALLAALMEEGDRAFNQLASEIDGMMANYASYAKKSDVEREIDIQKRILDNEPNEANKPAVALQLAKLYSGCGNYSGIIDELKKIIKKAGALRTAALVELGYAMCKKNRRKPDSKAYKDGQNYLKEVIKYFESNEIPAIPNPQKDKSLHARAVTRLAWSYEIYPECAHDARENYQKALILEPGNPYYIADVLGFEIVCAGSRNFIPSMSSMLSAAINNCNEHIQNGTELPYAFFTSGRLKLLLHDKAKLQDAFNDYACGIRYVISGENCVPVDVLDTELEWINRVVGIDERAGYFLWIHQLIELAQIVAGTCTFDKSRSLSTRNNNLEKPVVIIAGGAASLTSDFARKIRPILLDALTPLSGTVISGGTRSGVPGVVGSVAETLKTSKLRNFKLLGYAPYLLPNDAPYDKRYDEIIEVGDEGFTPEQIIANWTDIIASGIAPSDVNLIGFGGGLISGIEYCTALALGAKTAVVEDPDASYCDASCQMLKDIRWKGVPGLLAAPLDSATVRALLVPAELGYDKNNPELIEMARAFHERYIRHSSANLAENMKPWDELNETYVNANIAQAKYATTILKACDFKIRQQKSRNKPEIFKGFTTSEINRMAEMEHGRWNIDRLTNNWRPGKTRDDDKKIHPSIVPWKKLPNSIRKYDIDAVKEYPAILAKAGLEIYR